jgi:SAM-dependent methyltransferase
VELHRRFSVNPTPVTDWELRLVDLTSVRQAVDVGCGTGSFLLPLARQLVAQGATVIGLDLAEGTLGQARARLQAEGLPVDCVIGDVEALPFDDSSFDLVLANYMLYHVPDLQRAIAQLRRVLRPGGTLLAASNGQGHMRELWQMQEQALSRLGFSPEMVKELGERARAAGALSFGLENGAELLCRSFTEVRMERYPDELQVTEVEPLVAYLDSQWSVEQMLASLPTTAQGQAAWHTQLLESFRAVATERLAADGVIRIVKDTGAFVAL